MEKALFYDNYARDALVDSFSVSGHTGDDVYEFVWGKCLDEANHDKAPPIFRITTTFLPFA